MDITVTTVTLGTPDARQLAAFYRDLLGGEVHGDDDTWVVLRTPNAGMGIAFQTEPDYQRPVWPEQPGQQQMMCVCAPIRPGTRSACGSRPSRSGTQRRK